MIIFSWWQFHIYHFYNVLQEKYKNKKFIYIQSTWERWRKRFVLHSMLLFCGEFWVVGMECYPQWLVKVNLQSVVGCPSLSAANDFGWTFIYKKGVSPNDYCSPMSHPILRHTVLSSFLMKNIIRVDELSPIIDCVKLISSTSIHVLAITVWVTLDRESFLVGKYFPLKSQSLTNVVIWGW